MCHLATRILPHSSCGTDVNFFSLKLPVLTVILSVYIQYKKVETMLEAFTLSYHAYPQASSVTTHDQISFSCSISKSMHSSFWLVKPIGIFFFFLCFSRFLYLVLVSGGCFSTKKKVSLLWSLIF